MQPGSASHRAATPPKKKKGATTKGKSTARSSSPAKSSRPKSSRPKPAKHKPAGPLRDITVPSDVETTDAAVQVQRPWTSSSWAPWVRSAAARSCDPQSVELPRSNYFEPHIWVGEQEAATGELEMENEAMRKIHHVGVACPIPVAAVSRGEDEGGGRDVVRADSPNGGDGINFARS